MGDNEGDQDDENKDQDIVNASEVNVIDEEVEKTSLKKGDSSSSSSSSEDEDKDEEPREDAPSEAVDPPPPTTYAKLITPSGFSAPSSSEYNATAGDYVGDDWGGDDGGGDDGGEE